MPDNTDKIKDLENTEEFSPVADEDVVRKANKYFFSKVIFNVCMIIIGALIIGVFLRQMQAQTAIAKQQENSQLALDEAVATIEENQKNVEELTKIFHDSNQDVLDDMAQLFSSGLLDSFEGKSIKVQSKKFAEMAERSEVKYMFLMNMDGKVVLSGAEEYYGKNPAARALMTQENVNDLLKGTVSADGTITPVTIMNQYGKFYFYSMPYEYKGEKHYLCLGTEADILEVQIGTLKDVSVVLSRAAVGNDGFMFAVDKEDGTFVYYKNGEDILTGQSALSNGLSEKALDDGYSGIETIKGVKYFCVSKEYGDKTVVCAVAEKDSIVADDRYVLFWSILGFVIVLMLCLSYAIIVRNDFVRHAVETEKKVLNPGSENPTYFDKSIFNKIFPLVLAGVLVMFGVSFYTQTLLEITKGIEKSNIALDEVSARYDESQTKRKTIENYYDNRFLAKAKLISFLIEENPKVLNADSDLYHSYYTKDGEKKYYLDDEGNKLKAVSASARLQELCDANDIESVYIFNEEGRTIGTNTDNWYFEISHDEEAQSNAFLKVLDGRVDSFVQEAMTNDLGESTQFIGVTFRYYTTVDENGDTVYVSRYDYEQAQEKGETGKITAHRSMIQIGLDGKISQKLLESTEVESVLSTNMLSGGVIVMFDTTDDHKCVFSPVETSIGKTAKELGVSPNAFNESNYYGFANINGTNYFTYFHYTDGYYIATALPTDAMYQARLLVSLITALISFLIILILSCTITLTNKEEEHLYRAMSEEQYNKGLNSAIFNIIMPSGRRTTTTKAAARWDNRRIPWSERSPEQKLVLMVSGIGGLLMLYVLFVILGADKIFNEDSIVNYITSGLWDRGANIFALSSCALVIITIYIGVALFRIPMRITAELLGARGETISHLLLSVVKYGGALGALFYCLYLLGIDSSRLLASAGILSLIIGLGAQSLIKDIIAGIFIVFEGEFRVGDIVTIGGYRGTVMDIGLRTTKILGMDGNIKIYNNSEISGVLNMTQEASVAMTFISIEYGQDIEYVEAVLNRELPKLREENPKILEGPEYLGIYELEDSGVKLIIICKCSEQDIKGVTRYLNRGVLRIFYKNHINVPFPNITFSRLNEKGRKTIEDIIVEAEEVYSEEELKKEHVSKADSEKKPPRRRNSRKRNNRKNTETKREASAAGAAESTAKTGANYDSPYGPVIDESVNDESVNNESEGTDKL